MRRGSPNRSHESYEILGFLDAAEVCSSWKIKSHLQKHTNRSKHNIKHKVSQFYLYFPKISHLGRLCNAKERTKERKVLKT